MQTPVPPPKPRQFDIYEILGPLRGLIVPAARENSLNIHKERLRKRHKAKLGRNVTSLVTVCGLGGIAATTLAGSYILSCVELAVTACSAVCANDYRGRVAAAAEFTCRSLKALPPTTRRTIDQRLNAALVRERTPRLLPVGPVRAIGNTFDRCFGTPNL